MNNLKIKPNHKQKEAIKNLLENQLELFRESKELMDEAIQKKMNGQAVQQALDSYLTSIVDSHEASIDNYTYNIDSNEFILKEEESEPEPEVKVNPNKDKKIS